MANMYPSRLVSGGSSAITFPKLVASTNMQSDPSSTIQVENNNYSQVTVGTVSNTYGSIKVAFYNATTQISSYTMSSNRTYTIPDGTVTIRFTLTPYYNSSIHYGSCSASNVVIS